MGADLPEMTSRFVSGVWESQSADIQSIRMFQLILLGCFCDAVDDSGTLGTTDGVYDFPVLLANAKTTDRPFCPPPEVSGISS